MAIQPIFVGISGLLLALQPGKPFYSVKVLSSALDSGYFELTDLFMFVLDCSKLFEAAYSTKYHLFNFFTK